MWIVEYQLKQNFKRMNRLVLLMVVIGVAVGQHGNEDLMQQHLQDLFDRVDDMDFSNAIDFLMGKFGTKQQLPASCTTFQTCVAALNLNNVNLDACLKSWWVKVTKKVTDFLTG